MATQKILSRWDGSKVLFECELPDGLDSGLAMRHALGIEPDSSRPAERWFMGIRKGDTPENSQISAFTVEWLDEFVGLIRAAQKVEV